MRRSGDKRKFGWKTKKGKQAKIFMTNLLYSVYCTTFASENETTKIEKLVGLELPDAKTYMKELLVKMDWLEWNWQKYSKA